MTLGATAQLVQMDVPYVTLQMSVWHAIQDITTWKLSWEMEVGLAKDVKRAVLSASTIQVQHKFNVFLAYKDFTLILSTNNVYHV